MLFARWFLFATLISVLGSLVVLGIFGGGQPLEFYLDQGKPAPVVQLPANSVTVTGTPVELALYETYGPKAFASERQYSGKAARVWALYGDTDLFRNVIRAEGCERVVPIVNYYLDHDAPLFQAQMHVSATINVAVSGAKSVWQHYKEGGLYGLARMPETTGSFAAEKLTPLKRGWLALAAIREIGPQFLGRYAVAENGEIEILFGRTGVSIVTEFAVGGLQRLEEKYKMGEEVTAADTAIAAVETASLAVAGIGVLRSAENAAKIARAGKLGREVRVVRAAGVAGAESLTAKSAALAGRTFKATGKYLVAGVGLYVVAQHPGVVSAAFRLLAESLGVPPWLGQLLGWAALFCAILSPIGWLLIILAPFVALGLRSLLGFAEWVVTQRRAASK